MNFKFSDKRQTILSLWIASALVFSLSAFAQTPSEKILSLTDDIIAGKIELDNSMSPTRYQNEEVWYAYAISNDPQFNAVAKAKTFEIAIKFLENNRPQEAIWTLERGQEFELAQAIEQKILKVMQESPLDLGERVSGGLFGIGAGITGAMRSQLGNIPVIVKPNEKYKDSELFNLLSTHGEVWAYRLDRILGFDRVPITVLRRVGNQEFSVQLMIKNAKSTGREFRDFGYGKSNVDEAEIYILDYLLDNSDRHGRNTLYDVRRKFVAIDHNRVYGIWPDKLKFDHFDKEFLPSAQVHRNIKAMNLERFKELMATSGAPVNVINFITGRLKEIQEALPEVSDGVQRPLPQ